VVERATGGRGGGRSTLTPLGKQLIERFEQVQSVHQRFLQQLDGHALDLNHAFSLLDVVNLRTSARNTLAGQVVAVHREGAADEVEVALDAKETARPAPPRPVLRAHITPASTARLGLQPGLPVLVLVKAPAVSVSADRAAPAAALPARVTRVAPLPDGALELEAVLEVAGAPVVAVVPAPAARGARARPVAGYRVGDWVALTVDPAQAVLAVLA
jgi:molybdate transport system regulatory protein